jgi:hypothetical protein
MSHSIEPKTLSPSTKESNLKVVAGQWTTESASDAVATGLSKIVSVVASLDGDPDLATGTVSAVAPASGGTFTLKSWDTAAASPFYPAATSFGKKVNYIAIGY